MTFARYQHRDVDVACTLGAADASSRLLQWQLLRDEDGLGSEALPNGARIWFRPEAQARVDELAYREAECCGFLDLHIWLDGDRLTLDVTSPAEEAVPVIALLAGLDRL